MTVYICATNNCFISLLLSLQPQPESICFHQVMANSSITLQVSWITEILIPISRSCILPSSSLECF